MAKGQRAPADPKISKCFADQMQKIIRNGGYTNVSFGEKAGISSEMVKQYLTGSLPRADILYRISIASGVPVLTLLTGESLDSSCPVGCDAKLQALCEEVKHVMESKTAYANALDENIHAFDRAVSDGYKLADHRKGLSI